MESRQNLGEGLGRGIGSKGWGFLIGKEGGAVFPPCKGHLLSAVPMLHVLSTSLLRPPPPSCSCVALGDLLGSRQVGEVADYLPRLWELVLRVRDDIKVREEGEEGGREGERGS